MAGKLAQNLTDRVWLRSPEEEQGPVRVYRGEEFAFPPARGREGMQFRANGTFELISIGRGDKPGKDQGQWRTLPDDPTRITVSIDGATLEFRIIEVSGSILRLEWLSP